MHFRWKIFRIFLMLAMLVFFIGNTSKPLWSIDRSFVYGTQLRTDIHLLEMGLENNTTLFKDQRNVHLAQIASMKVRLENIMVEARKRQYSNFWYHFTAVSVVILGLLLTLLFSWKADVKRLQKEIKRR